jgi:CheY-like chemotaxis protein
MTEKENLETSVKENTSNSPHTAKKTRKTYKKRSNKKTVKSGKTYGILIIEDEKSWKNVYKINLFKNIQQKRKIKFYEASNAKEALKILVQYYDRIQVVILDLVIGGSVDEKSGGMILLETIMDRLGLKNLGIFIITAYGTKENEEQCYLRGVRGFLDKSQLDFENLSGLIDNYFDIHDLERGTEVGIYAESRLQNDRRYLYLRWKHSDGTWDMEYIANMKEIERIVIPNMITDLDTLEGLNRVQDEEEE